MPGPFNYNYVEWGWMSSCDRALSSLKGNHFYAALAASYSPNCLIQVRKGNRLPIETRRAQIASEAKVSFLARTGAKESTWTRRL